MHILDQEAPGLAEELKRLSLEQRRRIVANACNLASTTLIDLEPEVRDLLTTVAAENTLTAKQAERARTLAEAADERYFTLKEQGAADAVWIDWFFKARLLMAIASGFGGTSWSDAADAIYELCSTRRDPSEIIALARAKVESA